MRTIAIYNIKGGVGKTAAAVNLAYLASAFNHQTILCDLDPQGSATYYFRVRPARKFGPKKLIRGGRKMTSKIRGTDYPNLDLLPATLSHRNLDITLYSAKRPKSQLQQSLETFASDYDYVFLDCPPNITLVSENIFRAADVVVVPVIPTVLSRLALNKLLEFFKDNRINDDQLVAFFSMVEPQKRMHKEMMVDMGSNEGFLKTVVPFLSDIERMGVHREPVVISKPRSLAARRYRELWQEVEHVIDGNSDRKPEETS
jgi:cellulose biosynthesis protein BcsQ